MISSVQKSCSRSCSLVLPSVQKSCSKSCCFGVPMCSPPCKNHAVNRAVLVLRSVQKSCSRSCSLVFSFVQKSCSSLWKLLQTMGQTQYIYIYLFIYNYLHVSMYMWMFCNHRSPRPCLHTFFIVFRRVPPHTFHTFLVNMISHPHGIPPLCCIRLSSFVIAIFR